MKLIVVTPYNLGRMRKEGRDRCTKCEKKFHVGDKVYTTRTYGTEGCTKWRHRRCIKEY